MLPFVRAPNGRTFLWKGLKCWQNLDLRLNKATGPVGKVRPVSISNSIWAKRGHSIIIPITANLPPRQYESERPFCRE